MSAVIPLRADPAPAADLSPARRALAATTAALADAVRRMNAAQQPAGRLGAILRDYEAAQAALAELRARDEQTLGDWLAAGANGPRPAVPADTLEAEKRLAAVAGDASAARVVLPQAEAEMQAAAQATRAAMLERDEALHMVAAEAAGVVIAEVAAKLAEAAVIEAKVESVIAELRRRHDGREGAPGALQAIERIHKARDAARAALARVRDEVSGTRLLAALVTDPGARL
jgi:hypothetical protein